METNLEHIGIKDMDLNCKQNSLDDAMSATTIKTKTNFILRTFTSTDQLEILNVTATTTGNFELTALQRVFFSNELEFSGN